MFICKKSNKHKPFAYANINAKINYMFMFICNSNKLLNEQKKFGIQNFVHFSLQQNVSYFIYYVPMQKARHIMYQI